MLSTSRFIAFRLTRICVIFILTQICISCSPAEWFLAEKVAERGIEDIVTAEEERVEKK